MGSSALRDGQATMKPLTTFVVLGVWGSGTVNGNVWGYEVEELENLRLEGGFQPISPSDALTARSKWEEGGDVIMGTHQYPPDPPREIITAQNMENFYQHPSLEGYEGTDLVDRTFYKYHKYKPFHYKRPVLKLHKLKNLKLALKSKLKSKLKFPKLKLKKLKFKGLHKPKRKPPYKPHYETATPQEHSYSFETTNKPTTTTSHPSYSPVFEEPTSFKPPAPKSPPSTSLAPSYSPPYR